MNILLIALVGLLLSSSQALDTVTELNVDAYLGVWYEVASSPLVRVLMEKDGNCVKAHYTLNEDGTIDVINGQRKGSVSGEISTIHGFANQTDASAPGQLTLEFDNLPMKAPYWIIALGPIVDGQYEYVVVSEPREVFMWVLARDPQVYLDQYEASVKLQVTQDFGFNKLYNKYISRSHVGCVAFDL